MNSREETYGDRVAFAMALRKIAPNELERLSELPKGEGSRLPSRIRPQADTADKVARGLRVSTSWLMSGFGPRPTKASEYLPLGASEGSNAGASPIYVLEQEWRDDGAWEEAIQLWRSRIDALTSSK